MTLKNQTYCKFCGRPCCTECLEPIAYTSDGVAIYDHQTGG
ncbi:hypothetical protein BH09ACT9_BH09ACT9_00620 [soil metagenome]